MTGELISSSLLRVKEPEPGEPGKPDPPKNPPGMPGKPPLPMMTPPSEPPKKPPPMVPPPMPLVAAMPASGNALMTPPLPAVPTIGPGPVGVVGKKNDGFTKKVANRRRYTLPDCETVCSASDSVPFLPEAGADCFTGSAEEHPEM